MKSFENFEKKFAKKCSKTDPRERMGNRKIDDFKKERKLFKIII